MSDQVRALKSLEVDDVKIYEARDGKVSVLTRGKLEIFYIAEYDRFMLRVNSFKYVLSIYLPIMASIFEDRAFRSYVLPNIGGHYIMKLKKIPPPPVIQNLETIFFNYSQLYYKSGQEQQLEAQAKHEGNYPMTFGTPYEEDLRQPTSHQHSEKLEKLSNYIRMGGEYLKQNIIKAANFGLKMMEPKTYIINQNSNQLYVRSIQELKGLNSIDSPIIDLPRYEVTGLITLSNEIENLSLNQAQEENRGFKNQTANNSWSVVKKTTIESAKSLWKGMDEALSILSTAIKTKRSKKGPKNQRMVNFERINQNEPRPHIYVSDAMQQADGNRYTEVLRNPDDNCDKEGYTQGG
jgi:hypothetical protein